MSYDILEKIIFYSRIFSPKLTPKIGFRIFTLYVPDWVIQLYICTKSSCPVNPKKICWQTDRQTDRHESDPVRVPFFILEYRTLILWPSATFLEDNYCNDKFIKFCIIIFVKSLYWNIILVASMAHYCSIECE